MTKATVVLLSAADRASLTPRSTAAPVSNGQPVIPFASFQSEAAYYAHIEAADRRGALSKVTPRVAAPAPRQPTITPAPMNNIPTIGSAASTPEQPVAVRVIPSRGNGASFNTAEGIPTVHVAQSAVVIPVDNTAVADFETRWAAQKAEHEARYKPTETMPM